MQGFVLTMAVLYVALNLLIDLLYGLVDPRVRLDSCDDRPHAGAASVAQLLCRRERHGLARSRQ